MIAPLEIWAVDLSVCARALLAPGGGVDLVAADDRARAERMWAARDRDERLAAHAALRLILKRHGADDGSRRPFLRLASGKPILVGHWHGETGPSPDGLDFSLSHVDGLVLIGVRRGGTVGVDAERLRQVSIEAPRRTSLEAAADNLGGAGRLVPAGDRRRLQQAWTRLEALAKARGVGMAQVLAEIGVVGSAWRARSEAPDEGGIRPAFLAAAEAFGVRDLEMGTPGVVGAVAFGGAVPDAFDVRPFPDDAVVGPAER